MANDTIERWADERRSDGPAPRGAAASVRSPAIQRVLRHMDAHLMEPLSVEQLAQIAGLGEMSFSTLFRREVGMPPYRYLSHLRITRAMALLREGMPLAMVAAETGFFDQPHMYRHFRRVCGVTPGQYLADARRAARDGRGLAQIALAGLPS
jgi:transcriptional regulator GlxA family with amidase domain